MRPELRRRLTFGPIMALLLVGGFWVDLHCHSHWVMGMVAALAAAFGCREFARLARVLSAEVQLAPMLVVSVLLVGEAMLHQHAEPGSTLESLQRRLAGAPLVTLVLSLGLGWATIRQMFRHATERFFANVGSTLAGMVYLGVTLNLIMRLLMLDDATTPGRGASFTLLFLAAVKAGDIGAFFGGRAFGRTKMAPRISPGKTWEGFAFSFVGAAIGVYGIHALITAPVFGLPDPFSAWWQPALWAVVLAPLGVLGDLAESCMKRDANTKDSGTSLPGFGGVLDVLDAVLIAAPVAYLLAIAL